jgi:predicted AAA+ superfamily ATPase
MELFPFSYREFTTFKKLDTNTDSLNEYLKTGGIPEYVKSGAGNLMSMLLDDILVRDMGFYTETSTTYTDNTGHRLENLVYLHLRHHYKELFYFRQKGECDFIAFNRGKAERVLQVCQHIDDTNLDREYNGLVEAMKEFKTNEGVIVTLNQKDRFEKDGITVRLIPVHEYLSE